MSSAQFERFKSQLFSDAALGLSVDVSRIHFADGFMAELEPRLQKAYAAMAALEGGAIANPDENRQVGHYWLRDAARAPTPELRAAIADTVARIHAFAQAVHQGRIRPERAPRFENVLVVGIGGSALGPEFVAAALTSAGDRMKPYFSDNSDPDGIDRVFDAIGAGVSKTLTVVISKSGGTKETRNGMLEAKAQYARLGLDFGKHAVAVTGAGSQLDQVAAREGFLATFPMWDWVGGRTSELSAVGLLPAALQGIDIDAMLRGARAMDAATRGTTTAENPAALLAAAWMSATSGHGKKDMVVLPYKDRLELFSRYLQQLVMESLGKKLDLAGNTVHQGIAVYGNKGSTDQHAYVQQLRDGLNNFFVTFIEVLRDRAPERAPLDVEPGVTSGDYLSGFLQGTRQALFESGRESLTLTLDDVSPESVGKLIALYERTVGFYGTLVGINAYHQPGVEAGKKAAASVLALQGKVLAALKASGKAMTLPEIAQAAGSDDLETTFMILRHASANPGKGVRFEAKAGASPLDGAWRARE